VFQILKHTFEALQDIYNEYFSKSIINIHFILKQLLSTATDMTSRTSSPPGSAHTKFRTWAEEQGVKIHGVSPAHLPGKGTGMIATRPLKVN